MSDAIDSLFSIQIGFDDHLVITETSSTLSKFLPQVAVGTNLLDHFHFHRPSKLKTFEEIQEHKGLLALLVSNALDFAIRGQIVSLEPLQDASTSLIFLGSPWVGWLSAHRDDISPKISDFGAQDAQLDQIFLTVTQQQNVKDLQELAEKLRVEKERSEEASNIRSDFFAVMNHEMRTPLNGVITALNLIDKSQISLDEARLFDMAMSSADNLLVVINNVLDFSKLEANKFEIEETRFSLEELLASVRDILIAKASQKGIELKVEIPIGLPSRVLGDDSKIRQVLINLASNAVKFTDKGAVTLSVSIVDSESGLHYEFAVEDTGHGVNPEIQKNIFEPFWTQVNGRAEIGTGLGLYICRRLIQMMDSDIEFVSEPGKGSRFWFSLDLEVSEESSDTESTRSDEVKNESGFYDGRVLLVEDNPTNQALARILIRRFGPAVDVASDGMEAIAMVKSYPYDLVFMDINMPTMGGIEATEVIRKDSAYAELPIIALTAYSGAVHKEKYLSMGMNGYLKKPIETVRLEKEFSKWLPARKNSHTASEQSPQADINVERISKTLEEKKSFVSYDVDSEIFRKLYLEVGEGSFHKFFDDFINDLSAASAKMTELCIENDREELSRQAHSLSSILRTFGAVEFGDALSRLEETALIQSFDQLDPEVDRLQSAFTDIIRSFKSELEKQSHASPE